MVRIEQKRFGHLPNGREVLLFHFQNGNGTSAEILNYGSIIRSIQTRDKTGTLDDIVLGFDDIEGYLQDQHYLGAFIGRYANRIAGASIDIDGAEYLLSANEGSNTNHGGPIGLNSTLWRSEVGEDKLFLRTTSPDGDQGFPGELDVVLTYELTEKDELHISMKAMSTKKTVVSFTQHPYFNLSGIGSPGLDDHQLQLAANQYLPINEQFVPTGELIHVAGTPFDFRQDKAFSESLEQDDPQLIRANGFDHCFVVDDRSQPVARLTQTQNGRSLEVFSNAPGVQVYTSNYLNGEYPGKSGNIHQPRQAVCLEPQAFPNAPKTQNFPSTILDVDATYRHQIVYKFGIVS